ncbi:hypothetical protein HYV91_03815 [Candidatus Wolfebacteria bacterium]|nr:hypothetical protein [Candidatus Wolfebacteria bacterium]
MPKGKIRIAAIVLVISAGIVGSYLIVKNSAPTNKNYLTLTQRGGLAAKSVNPNPVQWVKAAQDSEISDKNFGSQSGAASLGASRDKSEDSSNLTRFFAKTLFGRMQKLDQSGKEPFQNFDIKDPQNKKLLDESIAEIQSSPASFLKEISEDIDEQQIKITTDNSAESKSRYLEATAKIILSSANDSYRNQPVAVQRLLQAGDAAGVRDIADAYSKIFNGFLNIEVPSSWSNLHLRYLRFLKKESAVYSGLLNFQTDPVKASLLIQLLPDLSEIESALNQEYYGKARNLNS